MTPNEEPAAAELSPAAATVATGPATLGAPGAHAAPAVHTAPAARAATAARGAARELAASLAALAGFVVVSALYLRPIWRLWRTHLAPEQNDTLFNLYLLKWVGHEAGRAFHGFWDAPFFYPARGVLAYSDHMLGPGLAAAAWNLLLPGWVGAYNVLLLAAFALTGWAMSWMLRRSGRSWRAALLGGALYAFCPFRWDQLPHLQVLMMAAIPVVLWSFDRLLARPSWARTAAFLPAYAVHLSGGCYLAAMIHLPLAALAGNRAAQLWRGRRAIGRRGFAALAVAAAVAAALLAATFSEYRRVGARVGLAWSADAERHWGASLLSYLQPSDSNLYSGWWPRALFRSENCLFPGFVAAALCLAGAWLAGRAARAVAPVPAAAGQERPPRSLAPGWRGLALALALAGWVCGELLTWSEDPRFNSLARWTPVRSYGLPLALTLGGVALWSGLRRRQTGRWPWAAAVALGPWPRGLLVAGVATALASTPLVYLPLCRILPGLAAMRVPARFQAFTMLSIAFFAAAAFDSLLLRQRGLDGARRRRRAALLAAAVAAVALLECAPRALAWDPLPEEADFPGVYAWLARQADVHALLELPLKDPEPTIGGLASLQAMYFGTRHWRPLVNGFSAHFPLFYEQLEDGCCYPMPGPETLAELEHRGVTHILLHTDGLPRWQLGALRAWGAANAGRAALVYRDGPDSMDAPGGGDRVYRLLNAAGRR